MCHLYISVQPFDVVKTRQQAVVATQSVIEGATTTASEIACNHDGHVVYRVSSSTSEATATTTTRPTTVAGHLRSIYEAEGLHGLWRGNQARIMKVVPSCAIMITAYEMGKHVLQTSEP